MPEVPKPLSIIDIFRSINENPESPFKLMEFNPNLHGFGEYKINRGGYS